MSQSRPVVNPRQHYAGVEYTPSSVLLQRTGNISNACFDGLSLWFTICRSGHMPHLTYTDDIRVV